jgi:hypothetical protein
MTLHVKSRVKSQAIILIHVPFLFQSESGSMEQINTADVDDKDVLEGLFKENKEILDFLSSGLPSKGNNQTPMRSQETLGEISEEKDDEESGESKISQKKSPEVIVIE